MNSERLIAYINNPALLNEVNPEEIKRVVDEFPASGILHAIYLKALKNQGSYLYPKQLKRTAIAVPSRERLHHWAEVEVGDVTETEAHKIEFKAAEAAEKAKQEKLAKEKADKEAALQKQKAAEVSAELAKKKAESTAQAAEPPAPATPAKPAESTKEIEIDLSHLPASVRETVLRARKIRSQFGEDKAQPQTEPAITPKIEQEKATETTQQPTVEKEPEPAQAPVAPPVPETTESTAQEVVKETKASAQKEPTIETKESPTEKQPTTSEVSFDLTEIETPEEETAAPFDASKHSFLGWLHAKKQTEAAEQTEQPKPESPAQSEPATEENPAAETPTQNAEKEDFAFEFSVSEPITPTPKAAQASELLESFLEKPRIKFTPPADEGSIEAAGLSTSENADYITETLAHVYVRQKLYSRAINAYEILRLKYPEKSSFFAAQILEIKQLLKEKN